MAFAGATTVSPAGIHFLMDKEAFRGVSYNRDGKWTVAWGHTGLMLDGTPVGPRTTCDETEGMKLLQMDADSAAAAIIRVASNGGLQFYQNELDALTSLVFNNGPGILGHEHSLGLALIQGKRQAVADAILLYENATIDGKHGPWLRARRQEEYRMFVGGPMKMPLPDKLPEQSDQQQESPCLVADGNPETATSQELADIN